MSLDSVKYDAFISYRHCELDSFISENLHKKLESYKMPKSVVKKLGAGKTQIERVFRDEAELPLSNNLSDPISEALNNSEFLIVICTPRLPQSQWCKKEVETFVATHDRKHVLLVLAEGEPEESFPEILMYEDITAKDENGNDITVRVDREPLAADCRGDNNQQRLKAMDNVVLKICAAIFNLNYDDLKQRHRERQIRRRIIAMSAALAIVSIFAVTCLGFMLKINNQRKEIQDKYAGTMASASEQLLSQGLQKDALYAVRQVLPDSAKKGYNKDAYYALVNAVAPYEIENSYFPAGNFKIPQDVLAFSISKDRSKALVKCEGYFSVIDIQKDAEICRVDSASSEYAQFDDSGITYISDDMQVKHLDLATGNEAVLLEEGYDLYYAPGENVVLAFVPEGIHGFKGEEEAFYIDFAKSSSGDSVIDDPDYSVEDVYVTDDGKYAAFAASGFGGTWYCLIDVEKGQLKKCINKDMADSAVVGFDGDNLYMYYESEVGYTGSATGIMDVLSLGRDEETSIDLPGNGFYEMVISDDGALLVSDTLSCVLDQDYNIESTITGYMDAACVIASDGGFVILDGLGRMFTDNVFSSVDKSYSLYGHNDSAMISNAVYSDDEIFVRYSGSDRLVQYSHLPCTYEKMSDIGGARAFDEDAQEEVSLEGLSGIDGISVFCAARSDDGKYIVVSSNDGVLHVFDASTGKELKEVYNSGLALFSGVFPYLKNAGAYIIEGRVFDEDFNMISRLPKGKLVAVGEDEKSVVLQSVYSFDTYYKITLLTYDEMIRRADETLAGHVPDKGICDKYQIMDDN